VQVILFSMTNHTITTLVTGAPGWLGTRLLEVLTDPADPLQKYSGHKHRKVKALVLPGMNTSMLPAAAELVPGNVLDKASLEKAMVGVDTVFHLVGIIHPKKIRQLFDINTQGTLNMLEAAAKAGVKRVVFISSNSSAGVNLTHNDLMKESDAPRPYMAYGQSKLQAEEHVHRFVKEGKLEAVILRPCWFYGPGNGQPERQLRFFRMIHKGNPIMFGNGHNKRSMSYLDNTIQGMLLAEKTPQANGQIYWIADEKPYETIEIYGTIANIFGTKLKPRKVPGLASFICRIVDRVLQAADMYITEFHVAGEMDRSIACDVSKAKKELGYNPEVSLEEGMRRSIDWARKHQGLEI
jgi:nucleoside-diphosphate-sugar epimerase